MPSTVQLQGALSRPVSRGPAHRLGPPARPTERPAPGRAPGTGGASGRPGAGPPDGGAAVGDRSRGRRAAAVGGGGSRVRPGRPGRGGRRTGVGGGAQQRRALGRGGRMRPRVAARAGGPAPLGAAGTARTRGSLGTRYPAGAGGGGVFIALVSAPCRRGGIEVVVRDARGGAAAAPVSRAPAGLPRAGPGAAPSIAAPGPASPATRRCPSRGGRGVRSPAVTRAKP